MIKSFFQYYPPRRLFGIFFMGVSHLPMFAHWRWRFLKMGGVKFASKHPHTLIYKNVSIDTVHPELVEIGNHVALTEGVKILTHYLDPSKKGNMFKLGKVKICDHVFIGMNVIICNSVTIGEGSIIGAGAVVTKDIPPYQVWAGNPAKYIKDRAH
jgi:acetyltransferase-like isoleucine patch superfamily enzyme